MKLISVLLPAYNEEGSIGDVIRAIPIRRLREMGFETEIIVVDGKSEDRTREIAKSFGAKVYIQPKKGKGDAVRFGLKKCRGEYIVMLDADNTYPADKIPLMIEILEKNSADVVMGSRFAGEIEDGAMTMLNYFGNLILSRMAYMMFPNGHKITDVCTGMWAFRASAIKNLKLEAEGFDIEAELYAKLVKEGCKIIEIPIKYNRRKDKPKLRAFKDGICIGIRLLREV
ncbi:MAG: mannosyltransferase [Thermoplasmata archaeon]|nr:MAG: mannosyltransferase [Thermoplasmata archaeon]